MALDTCFIMLCANWIDFVNFIANNKSNIFSPRNNTLKIPAFIKNYYNVSIVCISLAELEKEMSLC